MKAPILAIALLLSLPAVAQTAKPAAPVPTDANFAALDALAKQDYDRAVRLWRPQAARGDKEAQYQLGLLASANGPQALRNPSEARLWLGKAAEQGHIEAQYQYGLALGWGDSSRPNRDGARQWLEKARDAGHPNAAAALAQLGTVPETAVATAPVPTPPPPPQVLPEAPPQPPAARQPSLVTSEPLAAPPPPPAAAPAPPPTPAPVPAAAPQPVPPPPPSATADLPPPPPQPVRPPEPLMPMTDVGPSIGELLSSGFNRPAAPSRDGGVLPPPAPPAPPAAVATAPEPPRAAPATVAPPPSQAAPEPPAPAAVPAAPAPITPPPPPVAALVQLPPQPTPAQALQADHLNARRQPGWQPRIVTDGAAQPALPLMSPPPPVREAVTVDLAALPPSAPTPTSPVTLIRPGNPAMAPQPAAATPPSPTAMAVPVMTAPLPLTAARPAPTPVPTPAVAGAPAAPRTAAPAPSGDGWRLRFAVLSKESSIPGTLTAYREKADAYLGEESITVEPVSASGPWRIFLNGRYEKSEAERRCNGIKKTGLDCLVTR